MPANAGRQLCSRVITAQAIGAEDDPGNAGRGYRPARKEPPETSLGEDWKAIVRAPP